MSIKIITLGKSRQLKSFIISQNNQIKSVFGKIFSFLQFKIRLWQIYMLKEI